MEIPITTVVVNIDDIIDIIVVTMVTIVAVGNTTVVIINIFPIVITVS